MSYDDENKHDDQNPFAAPQAELLPAQSPLLAEASDAERVRRLHLNHESSVKTIGWLQIFGGILIAVVGVGLLAEDEPVFAAILVAFALLQLFLGYGLTRLNNAARIAGIVVLCLGVLSSLLTISPFHLIIQAVFLYYLVSPKGAFVCTEQYREIIRQTPHIKRKTSCLVIGLLVFLLTIIALGAIVAWLMAPS